MIFVTVGTQLPFDRMIKCVDEFFSGLPALEVIAQTGVSSYKPVRLSCVENLSISEFEELFDRAEIIIAHAGMGTILSALCSAKPIIIMARESDYGEHRNDHQTGTAEKFGKYEGCFVFNDVQTLERAYQDARSYGGGNKLSSSAPTKTILELKKVISTLI